MNQEHFSGIPMTYDQLTSMLVSESCMRVAAETRIKELEDLVDLLIGQKIRRQIRPAIDISKKTFLIMTACCAVWLAVCAWRIFQ